MKLSKACRATMKALWREFRRCSYKYPPLYHDLVTYSHELIEPLRQYSLDEACKSFRNAFAHVYDVGWDRWETPACGDTAFFSRFYGSVEGLVEFRTCAISAYEVMLNLGFVERYPAHWGYAVTDFGSPLPAWLHHGWLYMLHDIAEGYPTPLLQSIPRMWRQEKHLLPHLVTPEDGGAPYPVDVNWNSLCHPVFTSSMAAIELLLDEKKAMLYGTLPDVPIEFPEGFGGPMVDAPFFFSERTDQPSQADAAKTVEATPQAHHLTPPVLEFRCLDDVWLLKFDAGGHEESHPFRNREGFQPYQILLAHPHMLLSPEEVLGIHGVSIGQELHGQEIMDEQYEADVIKEIERIQRDIDDEATLDRKRELEEQKMDLAGRLIRSKDRWNRPRTTSIVPRLLTNQIHMQLGRARKAIGKHMPEFAAYLKAKVHAKGGYFGYCP